MSNQLDDMTKLYRVRRTCLEILNDRNYIVRSVSCCQPTSFPICLLSVDRLQASKLPLFRVYPLRWVAVDCRVAASSISCLCRTNLI